MPSYGRLDVWAAGCSSQIVFVGAAGARLAARALRTGIIIAGLLMERERLRVIKLDQAVRALGKGIGRA